MYHVSAQGVDERMINVHYYYYVRQTHLQTLTTTCGLSVSKSAALFGTELTLYPAAVRDTFHH